MSTSVLQGMRVGVLVSDGFLEPELVAPKGALERAGAATFVIAPTPHKVNGWTQTHGEKQVSVDIPLDSTRPEDFHALLLPGCAPDAPAEVLNPHLFAFANHFVHAGKPIAAIGDGSRMVLQAGDLHGCRMTSGPSIRKDLERVGATWVDQDVVRDGAFVTSRGPDDLPAFNREMIRLFAQVRERSTEMRKAY